MRCGFLALALVLALLPTPTDVAGQVGVAGGFGTTGFSGEVAHGLGERLVLRAGAGLSTLDVATTFDSIPVELDLPGELYMGGLDFYMTPAFRVGVGIMVRPARVGVRGTQGDSPTKLGPQTLTPEELGSLTGVILARKQAPYLLVGFGKHVAPGVGLSLDAGAAYLGTPTTTLRAAGGTFPEAELETLLRAEEQDFDNEMKTYLKVWPILRLAVRVGLGERPEAS